MVDSDDGQLYIDRRSRPIGLKPCLAQLRHLFNFGWMLTHRMRSDLRAAQRYFRGRLLDVGCGDKVYENIVGRWVDRYWGVEVPSTHASGEKVDVWADGTHLPFGADTFDTILCTQVLEHVTDPERLLVEITRVLRRGGYLILSAPFVAALHEEPHDYYRFSRYALDLLLRRAGLTRVELRAQGGFWFNVGQNLGFYLMDRANRNWLSRLIAVAVWAGVSPVFYLLDRLFPDERYTMNYFAVACRQ